MKIKSFAVIALLVLGCSFASAQTFGFASVDSGLYCNYEQLSAASSGIYAGFDNLSACGMSVNATLIGFTGDITHQSINIHGAGVFYGDNVYAIEGDPDAQWEVFTKLACSREKNGKYVGPFGWIGVAGFSGVYAGGGYGYLTCTIPSKTDGDAIMRGPASGKIPERKK